MPSPEVSSKRVRDLLPEARYLPADSDPVLTAVTDDAAAVRRGDLYVHTDGFDFAPVELAADRGAAAVITEHPVRGLAVPQVVVTDAKAALERLRQQRAQAVRPLRILRVGGSAGSERAANWLAAVHAAACQPVGLRTERIEDDAEHCLRRAARSQRGPEAWLERCRFGGVTTVIDQALPRDASAETDRTTTPAPADLVCLTTLRWDGLDSAGRRAWPTHLSHRYAGLTALGPLTDATTLIVPVDDADACRLAAEHTGPVLTFGESSHADLVVTPLEQHTGGQTLLCRYGDASACVQLGTPGRAARRDAAAAMAGAIGSGMPLAAVAAGLEAAPAPPLFMEPLVCGQRFAAWLDAAIRPCDLADTLEAARSATPRVLAAVRLSGSISVAREQLAVVGRMADRVLAHGPVTARLPEDAYPANTTPVDDRLAALAVVLGLADEGEGVVIAGCLDAEVRSDGRHADRVAGAELLSRRLLHDDRAAA